MKKVIIPIIIILALIMIILFRPVRKTSEVVPVKYVEVRIVDQGSVKKRVELLGSVIGDKQVQIMPEVIGRVKKKLKSEGGYVKVGDPILIIQNDLVGFEYKESYLKSPISGRLARIFVDVGQRVGPQSPVAMVVDARRLKIEVGVPERFATLIRRGMKAEVKVGSDHQLVRGKIIEIGPVVDPNSGTILVRIRMDRRPAGILPGMVAQVQLILDEKKDVVRIPSGAQIEDHLFVIKGNKVKRVKPEIGLIGDDYLEVSSGVAAGDTLVVFGQEFLEDRDEVRFEVVQ